LWKKVDRFETFGMPCILFEILLYTAIQLQQWFNSKFEELNKCSFTKFKQIEEVNASKLRNIKLSYLFVSTIVIKAMLNYFFIAIVISCLTIILL